MWPFNRTPSPIVKPEDCAPGSPGRLMPQLPESPRPMHGRNSPPPPAPPPPQEFLEACRKRAAAESLAGQHALNEMRRREEIAEVEHQAALRERGGLWGYQPTAHPGEHCPPPLHLSGRPAGVPEEQFAQLLNQVDEFDVKTKRMVFVEGVLSPQQRELLVERFKQVQNEAEPTYHLNTARTVAVADTVFWNEDMATCPHGVKVQLLGAGGVASYAEYHGDTFWIGWQPIPSRRPR